MVTRNRGGHFVPDSETTIRKFLDKQKDSSKRLKALRFAHDRGLMGEQEFFEKNITAIFYVLRDAYISFEVAINSRPPRLRRANPQESEFFYHAIYFTLESVLIMLPHRIHEHLHYNCIFSIIKQLLHNKNTIGIRKRGTILIVLWILALQENSTDQVLTTFGQLVPLIPPPLTSATVRHSSPISHTEPDIQVNGSDTPIHSEGPTLSSFSFESSRRSAPIRMSVRRHDWIHPVEIPALFTSGVDEKESELASCKAMLDYLMSCMVNMVGYLRWKRNDMHERGLHFLFYQFKQHYLSPVFPQTGFSEKLYPDWVNYHKNDSIFQRIPITSPTNSNRSLTPTSSIDQYISENSSSISGNVVKLSYDLRDPVYAEIQNVIIEKLLFWINPGKKNIHNMSAESYSKDFFINGRETILQILFTRPENTILLHDIFHQAFKLSPQFNSTIKRVASLLECWSTSQNSMVDDDCLPLFLREPLAKVESSSSHTTTASVLSSNYQTGLLCSGGEYLSVSQQPLMLSGANCENSSMNNLILESTSDPLDDELESSLLKTLRPETSPKISIEHNIIETQPQLTNILDDEELLSTDSIFPPRLTQRDNKEYFNYDMVWATAYGAEPWEWNNSRLGLQINLRLFISHTSRIFLLSCTNEAQIREHVNSCERVLKYYQKLGSDCIPDEATWAHFLQNLLDISAYLYRDRNSSSLLSQSLADMFHSTVFGLFIRANLVSHVENSLWDNFLDVYSEITDSKSVICQWSLMMKGLTLNLGYFVYGVDILNSPIKLHEQGNYSRKPQSFRKRPPIAGTYSSAPAPVIRATNSAQLLGDTTSNLTKESIIKTDKLPSRPESAVGSYEEQKIANPQFSSVFPSNTPSIDLDSTDEPFPYINDKGRNHPVFDRVRRKRTSNSNRGSQTHSSPSPSSSHSNSNASTPQMPHYETKLRAESGDSVEMQESLRAISRPQTWYEGNHEEAEAGQKGGQDPKTSFSSVVLHPLRRQYSGSLRSSSRCASYASLYPDFDKYSARQQTANEAKFMLPLYEKFDLPKKTEQNFALDMIFLPVLYLNYQQMDQNNPRGVFIPSESKLEDFILKENLDKEISPITTPLWNCDKIALLWKRMIGILNDPTRIQNPDNLFLSIKCLSFIINCLDDVTQNIPFVTRNSPYFPNPFHFITWLYSGCLLPSLYCKSIRLSYEIVCKIHLKDSYKVANWEQLEAFYCLMKEGFTYGDIEVPIVCVQYCSSLFSHTYPGISCLVPSCTQAVRKILESNQNIQSRISAIALLGPMLSIIHLYSTFNQTLDDSKLDETLIQLLFSVIKDEQASIRLRILAIHQLTTVIYQIFTDQLNILTESPKIIYEALDHIFISMVLTENTVCINAVDMLAILSEISHLFANFDTNLSIIILKSIVLSIIDVVNYKKATLKRDQLSKFLIPQLHCLRNWLHAVTLQQIAADLLENILIVIHCCLNDESIPIQIQHYFEENILWVTNSTCKTTTSQPMPQHSELKRRSSEKLIGDGEFDDVLYTEVRTTLTSLLYLLGHFPFGPGMTQISSHIKESHDIVTNLTNNRKDIEIDLGGSKSPSIQYYIYNDHTIISFIEINSDNMNLPCNIVTGHKHVRIIIRDAIGKFAWDTCALHSIPSHFAKNSNFSEILSPISNSSGVEIGTEIEISRSHDYLHNPNKLGMAGSTPIYENSFNEKDSLNVLLNYLSNTSPEVLENRPSLNVPMPCENLLGEPAIEAQILESIGNQIKLEESYSNNTENIYLQQIPIEEHVLSEYQKNSKFTNCLSLLSQMGYFSWENRNQIYLIDKNKINFANELKTIDRIGRSKCNYTSRKHYKIGVIYIGPGQESQKDILQNTNGSRDYENFISGLGWEVDTRLHTGYMGGMSATQSNRFTYFADVTCEVVFHVSTRIITTTHRGQDVKIQHIGNDEVVIIWSQHWHDYNRLLFRTEFMDVLIIIYPLNNGLYRIQICKRQDNLIFGPLYDGSLVRRKSLAPLVRATAINALKTYQIRMLNFFSIRCNERAKEISKIIQKYKRKTSFEQFVSECLQPSGPTVTEKTKSHSNLIQSTNLEGNEDSNSNQTTHNIILDHNDRPVKPTKLMLRAKDSVTGHHVNMELLMREDKSVNSIPSSPQHNRPLTPQPTKLFRSIHAHSKSEFASEVEHRV